MNHDPACPMRPIIIRATAYVFKNAQCRCELLEILRREAAVELTRLAQEMEETP